MIISFIYLIEMNYCQNLHHQDNKHRNRTKVYLHGVYSDDKSYSIWLNDVDVITGWASNVVLDHNRPGEPC